MEAKILLTCDDNNFGYLKVEFLDDFVFFDGIERENYYPEITEEDYNSIIRDPGDCTMVFNASELYLFAKTVVSFYEMNGIKRHVGINPDDAH